jgi:hypothetical protein
MASGCSRRKFRKRTLWLLRFLKPSYGAMEKGACSKRALWRKMGLNRELDHPMTHWKPQSSLRETADKSLLAESLRGTHQRFWQNSEPGLALWLSVSKGAVLPRLTMNSLPETHMEGEKWLIWSDLHMYYGMDAQSVSLCASFHRDTERSHTHRHTHSHTQVHTDTHICTHTTHT